MDSRKIIYSLHVLLFILVINIVFYNSNESYNSFVRNLKYGSETPETQIVINDDYGYYSPSPENVTYINKDEETGSINDISIESNILSEIEIIPEADENTIYMQDDDIKVLNRFAPYNLKRLFEHGSLFDLTTEYPDDYFEYLGGDISIYFFVTKSYENVKEVFEAISYTLPFSIKEVTLSEKRAFFLNLEQNFSDDYIRLVVEYKKRVFWLKIKKTMYNEIKNLIQTIE